MAIYKDIKGTTHSSFRIGTSAVSGRVLTTDAAGVGTWQDQVGGSSPPTTFSKSFMITNPNSGADGPIWRVPEAITITGIHVLCIGGTSVTGNLWEYDSNGDNGATVDADITAPAGTNTDDDGSISNPSIASGNYLGWKTTSVEGSPTYILITFEYTATVFSRSFAITNPTAVSIPMWRVPMNLIVTAVHVLCFGGTNLVGQLWKFDENGANGEAVDSSDITATADTNTNDITLDNASIALGDYIGWGTTSVSGSVSTIIITFEYMAS